MDDETMNLMIAQHLPAAFAQSEACPPPESWAAFVVGDMSGARAAELARHADGCRPCAAERRLAELFLEGGKDSDSDDVAWIVARLRAPATDVVAFRPRVRRALPAMLGVAAAAALVIALLPGLPLLQPGVHELPPPSGVVRGAAMETVAPRGELPATPAVLQWHARAGASAYRVTLTSVDDVVLWQDEVTADATSVAVPADVAERLHPAVVYSWTVQALDERRRPIAGSAMTTFRIEP